MPEKRLRSNLIFILLGSLGCIAIWQIAQSPESVIAMSQTNIVYTLYTQNSTVFSYPIQQLPATDYNQLIDLNFSFTMLKSACNESSPLLLVLVHSSPKNFAKRRTIRETWGGQLDDSVKILFMIGAVNSSDLQKSIEEEDAVHNDFVQGTFLDTYRNITYKHVMVFKYAIYHCPKAKYVLKTDDDVFVNMPAMRNFLTVDLSPYGASRMLLCTPREHATVLRSYRSKWRVSFAEYPNNSYPTYCPGWTLLYSPDVLFDLYREAQIAEYFWIDDIHITGTLIEKIHLTHTDIEPLVISQRDLKHIVYSSYNISNPFLYGRPNMKEKEIRALWRYVSTHPIPRSLVNKAHGT